MLFTQLKPLKQLNIGTQIYATHALDEYKAMPANKRDFDSDARHYAIDVKWQADNWSTGGDWANTDAEKAHEIGFSPAYEQNSRGTFISMAYAGSDYLRDGAGAGEYFRLQPDARAGDRPGRATLRSLTTKATTLRTGEINALAAGCQRIRS